MASPTTSAGPPPLTDRNGDSSMPNSSCEGAGAKPDPWEPLWLHVDEFREYFSYYLGARADLVRMRLRRLAIAALLVLMGAAAAATTAATATAILLIGLGEGLGRLLGERIWLGNLITGALVLATAALGSIWAARRLNNTARLRTIRDYALRRERQRRQFGRDVSSRTRSD